MGLQLKQRVFSRRRGNVDFYGDLAPLMNKRGTGILQRILPMEEEVMHRGEEAVANYRNTMAADTLERYYDWVDTYVMDQYMHLFGVE